MVRLKISPVFSIFFFIRPPCSWPKPFSHIHLSSWIFCLQSPVQTPRWRCAVQPRLESWKFKSNKNLLSFPPVCSQNIIPHWFHLLAAIYMGQPAAAAVFRLRSPPIRVVWVRFLLTQGWHQFYVCSFSFSFISESCRQSRLKHSQPRDDRITHCTQRGPQRGKTLFFIVSKATKWTVWTFTERLF